MNPAEVIRRLGREKREWLSYDETPEVLWTLRGINLCIKHVYDIKKEQSYNERLRRPRIHRWLAADLFQAIDVALRLLGRSERQRAIETLEKAKERAAKKAA